MKKSYKFELPLVYIEWLDAATHTGWDHIDNVIKLNPLEISSVGWLTRKDNKVIQITPSMCSANQTAGDTLTIPKGWVKTYKVLGSHRRQKDKRKTK